MTDYDRILTADMLRNPRKYSAAAIKEQARLLTAAENADAANVGTGRGVGDAMVRRALDAHGPALADGTAWSAMRAALTAAIAQPDKGVE